MKLKSGIVTKVQDVNSRSQALNYCLLHCPNRDVGCAIDCKLRQKWHQCLHEVCDGFEEAKDHDC
jgi:hypothetical protein